MNSQLASSVLVFLYLAFGLIGLALLFGWAFKRCETRRSIPERPNGNLEFADVVPKVQSLLSNSKPGLRLKNVLVPVDFSGGSLRALPYASFLANQFGCTVTLLYVVHLNIVGEERGIPLTRFVAEIQSAATKALTEMAPSISPTAKTVVRVGEPVNEVVNEVSDSDIDIVILGKPFRNSVWQRLLPTVEARISRRVPCPTLIAT